MPKGYDRNVSTKNFDLFVQLVPEQIRGMIKEDNIRFFHLVDGFIQFLL